MKLIYRVFSALALMMACLTFLFSFALDSARVLLVSMMIGACGICVFEFNSKDKDND